MKSTFFSKPLTALSLAAVLTVAGVTVLSSGQTASAQESDEHSRNGHGLQGTWRVQVTAADCTTGAHGPAFAAYLTFADGGTLTETTSNPALQPGQRTSGHGYWNRAGGHTYNAVSEAFILFDTPAHGPVPAFKRGVQRINQKIEVQDDAFTSDAITEFTDAGGNTVSTLCAVATGQRMK
jgi:hypothetical protein